MFLTFSVILMTTHKLYACSIYCTNTSSLIVGGVYHNICSLTCHPSMSTASASTSLVCTPHRVNDALLMEALKWRTSYHHKPNTIFMFICESLRVTSSAIYNVTIASCGSLTSKKLQHQDTGQNLLIIHEEHQCLIKLQGKGEFISVVASSSVWWPGLSAEVNKLMTSCQVCSELKRTQYQEPLIQHHFQSHPGRKLH